MRCSTRLLVAVQALALLMGGDLAAASSPPSSPTMIGTASRPTGGAAPLRERFVDQGLAIEVTVDPVAPRDLARPELREGDEAVFRFRITDAATGAPVSGIYPAGWMSRLAPGVEPAVVSCQDRVEELVGGSLFSRPEFDLNSYHVLALNDDATISVVDPFFGFGGSKLLAMLFLDSPGEDWALARDKKRLFVTLPTAGKVAVADTSEWKVTDRLETGPNPRRVAFQPDQGYLWVTWEEGVDVFDPRALTRSARIPTGRGAHEIAFSDDSRFAFVTNRTDGTVSVIDVRTLARVRDVRTGAEPVSVAWTPLGRAAWVSHADGTLASLDPLEMRESAGPVSRLRIEAGLGRIAFAPGGRLGFVVNPLTDRLHILDVSRGRIVQTGQMEKEPDLVAFSDELAYVRHRGSETVLMIPLGAVGEEGAPVPVIDFPGGQKPFGQEAGPATAAGIVQAPGARAVLVANPADRAVYFYKEGMAAPMGSFANYSRQPRAVLVIDRSLKESAPGVYESVTKLGRPGWYDLSFFLDAPRVVRCLRVGIDPDPEKERERLAAQPPRVEYLAAGRTVTAGRSFPLRLKVLDPASGEPIAGLGDVTVLSYQPPGTRQKRQTAREVSEGIYEIALVAEEPGSYYVYVQSLSRGLPFRASPVLHLTAIGESPPAP